MTRRPEAAGGLGALVDPAVFDHPNGTEGALPPAVNRRTGQGDVLGSAHGTNSAASAGHGTQRVAWGYTEASRRVLAGAARGCTEASHGVLAGVEGEAELSESMGSEDASLPSQLRGKLGRAYPGSMFSGGSRKATSSIRDGTGVFVDTASGHLRTMSVQEAERLINAFEIYADQGDITQADELLRKMESQNIGISVDTYNTIIQACAEAGDIDRAVRYLLRMTEEGIEADLGTYNSMIKACAPSGDVKRAGRLLQYIVEEGMRPDIATYGNICKVFSRNGLIREIETTTRLCETNGMPPTEDIYASLIGACGVASPPDRARAKRALEDLCHRGLRPRSVQSALDRVFGRSRTVQLLAGLGHMGPVDLGSVDPIALP